MQIIYNDIGYNSIMRSIASAMQVKYSDMHLDIPPQLGTGFIKQLVFDDGIALLYSDTCMNEGINVVRDAYGDTSNNSSWFTLIINDVADASHAKQNPVDADTYLMNESELIFLNSSMNIKLTSPPKIRVRSLRVLFEKDHLSRILPFEAADKFLSVYFLECFRKIYTDTIDAEYRMFVNAVLDDSISQPLQHIFLRNRMMLLLEKFMTGFIARMQPENKANKLKTDIISKLIKVENMLVRDYASQPPTIAMLSHTAGISATKLKADFKLLYGLPIYEYYQKHRMMHARALLYEDRYSVKEVGMMVGYANLGHFAASFRKEFGVLPSEINAANEKTILQENDFIVGG
jgi:AraC-like DNA-binding protein